MGTGWSLAFFAAAAVLAASLATAALAGELCRLPVRRIAAVSTIAALLLICGEVLALSRSAARSSFSAFLQTRLRDCLENLLRHAQLPRRFLDSFGPGDAVP